MTISQILDNKESTATNKIEQLAEVVAKARKAYGNGKLDITAPKVPTTDGYVNINLLSDEDKVALASIEIRKIIVDATAAVECTEGIVLDRKIEVALATNPVLVNITTKVDSAYI